METTDRVRSLPLLVGIVDRPAETLSQVARSPRWRWLWPTALLVASIVIYFAVAAPYLQQEARRAAALQLEALPADQMAAAQASMERFMSLPFILVSSILSALAGTVISWVIAAGILYFSSLLAGEDLDFGRTFAIIPWTWLPFALRGFVQAAWVAWRGELIAAPGLSGLVATGDRLQDARSLSFALLSQIDLFALWHLILIYAGLRGLARMRAGKAAWLTAAYAVINLAVRLIPVLIGRAFMPGA
ncbi:MAG TPA: hypothetical protein G4O02_12910 [Caldilineae bacterium]|nr:hypothetical protein [Caldilineae bacterium]